MPNTVAQTPTDRTDGSSQHSHSLANEHPAGIGVARPIALVALLLAAAMITVGILFPRMLPDRPVLPIGFAAHTMTVVDPSAKVAENYQQGGGGKLEDAPVARQWNLSLSEPVDGDVAAASLAFTMARQDTDTDLEGLLGAQVWSFNLDRRTGEVADDAAKPRLADTPATAPQSVDVDGSMVKFPQDTQQASYDFLDAANRGVAKAEFWASENYRTSDGQDVELYVFRQKLPEATLEKQAKVRRTGERELAVEPRTGVIVRIKEKISEDYVGDAQQGQTDAQQDGGQAGQAEQTGQGGQTDAQQADQQGADGATRPALRFDGETPAEQTEQIIQEALRYAEDRHTHTWGVALTVIGAIVFAASLIALFILRRPRRASRAAARN